MKRMSAMLAGLLCAGLLTSYVGAAEGGDRAKSSRVKFVRLTEQQVGEQEYLGVVVQQLEGTETATLLVPMRRGEGGKMIRNEDLAAAARRLTPGQIVEVQVVTDGGQKWLRRIAAVGGDVKRDGDKREGEVRRDGDKREGEVRRDGDKREGEVRREGDKREGEVRREGGDREREGATVRREGGDRDREGATVRREGGDREGATVRREGGDREREGATVRREGGDRQREGATVRREGGAGDRVGEPELKEQIKLLRQQVAEMEKALKELQEQIRQIKNSK